MSEEDTELASEEEAKLPLCETAADFLDAADATSETIEVDELKRSVIVQSITVAERQKIERMSLQKGMTSQEMKVELVLMGCVNSEGKKLFRKDDREKLMAKHPGAIDTIYRVVARLSKLPLGATKPDGEDGETD